MFKKFIVAFALLLSLSSCIKDRSSNLCNYDACAIKAPADEIAAVQKYLTDNGLTATQHCSGLFFTVNSPGAGASPNVCNNIGVRYKGMLTNGNVFDEQTNTFNFQLGGLIEGWKKGLMQLKQGGSIRLYVPPSLGYGNQDVKDRQTGNVVIPANSILIFDIELVTVS